jgi:hypothetical protein
LSESSSFEQTGEIYRRSIDLDGSGLRWLYQEIQSLGLASKIDWNALNLFLMRWAEVDPEGMLSHIIDTPSSNCMPLVNALFGSWPRSDLNAAQAGALGLSGLARRRAVERVVNYWIQNDYIAALDWLSASFSGFLFHISNDRGFGTLESLQWLDSLPQSYTLHQVRRSVFHNYMRADFEGAREYVERLPSPIIRNDFVDRISLGSVLSESSFAEAGLLLN